MAELTPWVASTIPVTGFCLKSVVSSILWDKSDIVFVDSWKELLRTIISLTIVVITISIISAVLNCRLFDLSWLLAGYNCFLDDFYFFLNFFNYFLFGGDGFFCFFIFKLKFFLWVQIWWIDRPFDFLLLLLFFNLLLLLFWLWSLLWALLRWSFIYDFFLFIFLIFFWDDDLWLLIFRLYVVV